MRIGVDIDGVLYQWTKTARFLLREVLPNSPYTKDGPLGQECDSWNHIKQNVKPEHYRWLWKEGVELGLFRHGDVVAGSVVGMRELAKDHDLIVITHRPKSAVNDTLAWLAFQQWKLAGVHILTEQQPKSSVRDCDIYVDDKPENVDDLWLNTDAQLVCLFDQPWNQSYKDGAVMRVKNWPELIERINET